MYTLYTPPSLHPAVHRDCTMMPLAVPPVVQCHTVRYCMRASGNPATVAHSLSDRVTVTDSGPTSTELVEGLRTPGDRHSDSQSASGPASGTGTGSACVAVALARSADCGRGVTQRLAVLTPCLAGNVPHSESDESHATGSATTGTASGSLPVWVYHWHWHAAHCQWLQCPPVRVPLPLAVKSYQSQSHLGRACHRRPSHHRVVQRPPTASEKNV